MFELFVVTVVVVAFVMPFFLKLFSLARELDGGYAMFDTKRNPASTGRVKLSHGFEYIERKSY